MIGVIDIGISNIGSVLNIFKHVGYEAVSVSQPSQLSKCSKIVLPGVGSFDKGIDRLMNSGLVDCLNEKVLNERIPILGICLGMQLMCRSSDEGILTGLGWVDAKVNSFNTSFLPPDRIPHMGWNNVTVEKVSAITDGLDKNSRFYFIHSYYVDCMDSSDILLTTNYGDKFVSAFQKDNIVGVQFHPEKSHVFGALLIKNFGAI